MVTRRIFAINGFCLLVSCGAKVGGQTGAGSLDVSGTGEAGHLQVSSSTARTVGLADAEATVPMDAGSLGLSSAELESSPLMADASARGPAAELAPSATSVELSPSARPPDAGAAPPILAVSVDVTGAGSTQLLDASIPPDTATSSDARAECPIANQVGTMTSTTSAEGAVTHSGVYGPSYEAWQVFDSSDDSMWISALDQTPAWLQYEFYSGPRIITEYALTFVNGSLVTRAPKDWNLEGWDDNSWYIVDSRTNETNWLGVERRSYTVADPGLFSQYRLTVLDDNDAGLGVVVVSLGRLELIGSICDETP